MFSAPLLASQTFRKQDPRNRPAGERQALEVIFPTCKLEVPSVVSYPKQNWRDRLKVATDTYIAEARGFQVRQYATDAYFCFQCMHSSIISQWLNITVDYYRFLSRYHLSTMSAVPLQTTLLHPAPLVEIITPSLLALIFPLAVVKVACASLNTLYYPYQLTVQSSNDSSTDLLTAWLSAGLYLTTLPEPQLLNQAW